MPTRSQRVWHLLLIRMCREHGFNSVLDAMSRSLFRDGQPVPLTPKAIEILHVLLQAGGSVVTKEALLEEVWPGTFVEESSITTNISDLRNALGSLDGNSYIETLPKRGYRFAPPVQQVLVTRSLHVVLLILARRDQPDERCEQCIAPAWASRERWLPPQLRVPVQSVYRETMMQPSPFPPGNFLLPVRLPS